MMDTLLRMKRSGRVASVVVIVLQGLLAFSLVFSLVTMLRHTAVWDAHLLYNGIMSLVNMAGLILLLFPVGGVTRSLVSGRTPFEEKNVRRLGQTALILSALAVIGFVGDLLAPKAVVSMIGVSAGNELTGMEQQVVQVSWHGVFSQATVLFVVFALVAWCLSLVFRYGAALQQQSDETL